jgi:4'-phosphopantetheinyl transferase
MSPPDDRTDTSDHLTAGDPEGLMRRTSPLRLAANTVDLWAFELAGPAALVEVCRSLLSPTERQRADRFVFARDRVRHTVAHGVLRRLLGLYCGLPPETLQFEVTSAGKPSLQTGSTRIPGIRFNLSHSEDRALMAVSDGLELGVDLERIRCNIDALSISHHYFFGAEREAIEGAPEETRHDLFFRYWTAKEAVLKAQGIGLGFPLDRFCIRFAADQPTAHVETFDPEQLQPDWRVRVLPCDAGWAGAVVSRGTQWDTRFVTDSSEL